MLDTESSNLISLWISRARTCEYVKLDHVTETHVGLWHKATVECAHGCDRAALQSAGSWEED